MHSTVTSKIEDRIALIEINSPPVNALSDKVRAELLRELRRCAQIPNIHGMILCGNERVFIAGADLSELDWPPHAPYLPEIVDCIENIPIPIIAAINGACLGGGLEIAMGCDYRIASKGSSLGLPETRLGLVPGAGGTQRLPRLTGVVKAVEMICHGEILNSEKALEVGILDEVVEDPLHHARIQIRRINKRRVSGRIVPLVNPEELEKLRRRITNRRPISPAISKAFELVTISIENQFEKALALERKTFLALRESSEARALRYLFKAERKSGTIGINKINISNFETIGIAGGGTMGASIAVVFLYSDFNIIVFERDKKSAEAALTRIISLLNEALQRGKLSVLEYERKKQRIETTDDFLRVAKCDLVLEAVFETYEAKKAVFDEVSKNVGANALIATNTSYLDIDKLAESILNPEKFVGMHFFAPAHIMNLVEVIRSKETSAETLAKAVAIVRKIGKNPVIAGNSEGFIGNRVFSAYRKHMEYLLESGTSVREIDAALEEYGFSMGPFAVFDLSGLDIAWSMRIRKFANRDPRQRYVAIPDRLCEAGLFGRKTGEGYYRYEAGARLDSQKATEIIAVERQNKAVVCRTASSQEIVATALTAMINEGAKLLSEGVAERPSDIDVVMVNGYGFPRSKGGPMFAADLIGLTKVIEEAERLAKVAGQGSEVAPMLRELVNQNRSMTAVKLL